MNNSLTFQQKLCLFCMEEVNSKLSSNSNLLFIFYCEFHTTATVFIRKIFLLKLMKINDFRKFSISLFNL
ncbi:hypothetical protein GJ496_006976 [Pomphorhynchus laevis]|nr:hypothetical protein GJ496_006976 [Pomphorhynchus laevis]